ncbi:ABC transporter substrate-binding protein [Helicobacter mastomyrinus]|uniref:ABC transporter substrate-binding protein n=1 Tax=Helicobacter mastomyrinus TaxID=287948 RepID=A0ABZ3F662_9HELI|nr:ABC transporter substrate-binding protein [uncultured Helicobacter sp.]
MKFIAYLAALMLCASAWAAYPYTHIDDKGYKTTIAKKPSRIVIAGGMWPLPSVIMLLEHSAKSIVYMPKASKNALKASFMLELFPQIAHIKDGENENIEELLLLKPDLFICHNANTKLCQAMKKSGIPTIEVSVSAWGYDSYQSIKGWLTLLAPILDKEEVAGRFLDYTQGIQKRLDEALQGEKNKPRALIIHHFDNYQSFSAGGIFANSLLQNSGAENVLQDKGIVKMTLEEAYRLNPDIIYLNNFNTLLPSDLLNNPLWQPLLAVQNKRVYKFPLGSYRPFAPSLDLPIVLLWLYQHNYPQYADNKALLAQTQQFYKDIFAISLTQRQAEAIFTPKKAAGEIK